jgi:hypothetical protein
MDESVLRRLRKDLNERFPMRPLHSMSVPDEPHQMAWIMGMRAGHQEVLTAIDDMIGQPFQPDPPPHDVPSSEDRSAADAAARTGSTPYGP